MLEFLERLALIFLYNFYRKHSLLKLKMKKFSRNINVKNITNEPVHEISNNVACATSKASDQTAHIRSLIRAFASRLSILW